MKYHLDYITRDPMAHKIAGSIAVGVVVGLLLFVLFYINAGSTFFYKDTMYACLLLPVLAIFCGAFSVYLYRQSLNSIGGALLVSLFAGIGADVTWTILYFIMSLMSYSTIIFGLFIIAFNIMISVGSVIGGGITYVMTGNRKESLELRVIPKGSELPGDGSSSLPIKVQFVNSKGNPAVQRSDTEVKLTTTSGTIKDVIVKKGTASSESVLTASCEFGQATITAKSGDLTANSPINFTPGKATLVVSVFPDIVTADGVSTADVSIGIKGEHCESIAPLENKTIELTATIGAVQGKVQMPAKSKSVTVKIRSPNTSGISTIIASLDGITGEGKMTFKSAPQRFCMHCGASMPMEASLCPVCGQVPPSGVDTKPCVNCKSILPEMAGFCDKCGGKQPLK